MLEFIAVVFCYYAYKTTKDHWFLFVGIYPMVEFAIGVIK